MGAYEPPLRYHVTEDVPGPTGWRCLTCDDDQREDESQREHLERTAYRPKPLTFRRQ